MAEQSVKNVTPQVTPQVRALAEVVVGELSPGTPPYTFPSIGKNNFFGISFCQANRSKFSTGSGGVEILDRKTDGKFPPVSASRI